MRYFLYLFVFLCSCLIGSQLQAQDTYKSAIGVRLGSPLSASFKTFINDQSALEAFVNYRSDDVFANVGWRRFGVGAAWQKHDDLGIDGLENLSWYYGAGLSAYFWSWTDDNFFSDYSDMTFGLQLYVGLDYAFDDVPVNISLDWVPSYFINGYVSGFGGRSGALSVRYIFAR